MQTRRVTRTSTAAGRRSRRLNGCRAPRRAGQQTARPGEQHVERHLFGVFCRRCDPSTRAMPFQPAEQRLPGTGGDPHHDPVGQDDRAARDRGTGRRRTPGSPGGLTGDRGLVDAGHPLDDVAVAGDRLAGDVRPPRRRPSARRRAPGRSRRRRRACSAVVSRWVARRLAAWALPRPSATDSARVASRTVSHSHTVIDQANTLGSRTARTVVNAAPTSTTNMTGESQSRRGSRPRSAPGRAATSCRADSRDGAAGTVRVPVEGLSRRVVLMTGTPRGDRGTGRGRR